MSFDLRVTMDGIGLASPVTVHATGRFDDETFGGVGTRSFLSDDIGVTAMFGAEPFEFRLVDETYWMYNPLGEPPAWSGFDVVAFGEHAGGNPLGAFDGDAYLDLIASATTEVAEVRIVGAGAEVWELRVRADDLVPMIASAGPAQRLVDAGAGDTGVVVTLELERNVDGDVTRVSGELDKWFAHAIELVEPRADGGEMTLDFTLEPFAEPLRPAAPCDSPEASTEDGLDVLVCPPA